MSTRSITPLTPADFTPEMGNYRELQPFRYWCQKVLPLVYDDSLSYYELLCKVVDYLNKTMEDVETLHGDVTNLHTAYEQLQNYVNNYFSNLDVQEEINNKLDEMVNNGTFSRLLNQATKSPIVVDSIDDMTQQNLLYILSSNMHIYQWNGSSFVDSGAVYSFPSNTLASVSILPENTDVLSLTKDGYYLGTNNTKYINMPYQMTNRAFLLFVATVNNNKSFLMFDLSGSTGEQYTQILYVCFGQNGWKWFKPEINKNDVLTKVSPIPANTDIGTLTDGFYLGVSGNNNYTGLPSYLSNEAFFLIVCTVTNKVSILFNLGGAYNGSTISRLFVQFENFGWKWFELPKPTTNNISLVTIGDSLSEANLYQPIIVSTLNLKGYRNYGVGGCGYTVGTTPTLEQVNNAIINENDIVLLMAGTNDYSQNAIIGDRSTPNSVVYNLNATIQTIMTKQPTCNLVVAGILNFYNKTTEIPYNMGYNVGNGTLLDYINAIENECKYLGVKFINLSATDFINVYNITSALQDTVHPTEEYYKKLGTYLSKNI